MRDVVVIGGGVVGLSIAWRASQRDLTVAVVDPDPGRGASWAAAGMLAPVSEASFGEEDLLQLNLEAARRFPEFIADLETSGGRQVGYRRSGSLMVARDADDAAALRRLHEFQQSLGLESRWMTGSETRDHEPALAPGIRGGVLAPHDHQVDNRLFVEALLAACRRGGVDFVQDQATAIETVGQSVVGVSVEGFGLIEAATTVVAAGCWSNRIDGIPEDLRPPVRPVKGQLLHLRARPEMPLTDHTIRALVGGHSFYLVARGDGRYVLGATVEEQGFDPRPTVDAVYTLLRDAFETLPGITELELFETVVGFRPGTPDNAPIIGPSGLGGLVYATGHYRNGVLLSPLTADLIVDLILGEGTDELPAAITPLRFRKEPSWT